jgi:hypothetical protein
MEDYPRVTQGSYIVEEPPNRRYLNRAGHIEKMYKQNKNNLNTKRINRGEFTRRRKAYLNEVGKIRNVIKYRKNKANTEKQNRFHKAMTRKLKTEPTNNEIAKELASLKGGSSHFQTLKKKAYTALKKWENAETMGRNITGPRLEAKIAMRDALEYMAKKEQNAYDDLIKKGDDHIYYFTTAQNKTGHTPLNMNHETYRLIHGRKGGNRKKTIKNKRK